MKFLKILGIVVLLLPVFFSGLYGEIKPTYNISGTWVYGNNQGICNFFQDSTKVFSILKTERFIHYFVGEYINETTIQGLMFRKNLNTGGSTQLFIIYNIKSNTSLELNYKALDSNDDLAEGRTGSGMYTKQ